MKFLVAAFVLLCLWQQTAAYYCPSGYFDCGDGFCVPDEDVCDGTDDCYNGADEDDCTQVNVNVGLAVGLAIAGFVVFIVLPVVIIVVCCCCCVGVCATAASSGTRRTRVVTRTSAPSSGPQVTVVNTSSSNMMQTPVGGRSDAYPPAYTPNFNAYQPAPPYKM